MSSDLDGSILNDLGSKGSLVKHNLAIDHLVDWLALDVEVDELAPLDLGVEHVPDLVPGDGHGDGAHKHLLDHRPSAVHLGPAVEVDSVGGGRHLLHHQLGGLLLLGQVRAGVEPGAGDAGREHGRGQGRELGRGRPDNLTPARGSGGCTRLRNTAGGHGLVQLGLESVICLLLHHQLRRTGVLDELLLLLG